MTQRLVADLLMRCLEMGFVVGPRAALPCAIVEVDGLEAALNNVSKQVARAVVASRGEQRTRVAEVRGGSIGKVVAVVGLERRHAALLTIPEIRSEIK